MTEELARLTAAERARGPQLGAAGTIRRMWRVPGRRANWGVWEAEDATALHAAIGSLPFFPYLDVEVIPLAPTRTTPSGLAGSAPLSFDDPDPGSVCTHRRAAEAGGCAT